MEYEACKTYDADAFWLMLDFNCFLNSFKTGIMEYETYETYETDATYDEMYDKGTKRKVWQIKSKSNVWLGQVKVLKI